MTDISDEDDNLIEIVRDSLIQRGVFSQIKAKIRAEVYKTLDDKTIELPSQPREVFIAGELIREFLISMGLQNSLAVFSEEMGQRKDDAITREFIAGELGYNALQTDKNTPLLVAMVQNLSKKKESYDIGSSLHH